ncbi:hypothetical protein FACS189413_19210 [Bacteroidia bacterium]|nr:hypothetical protein FACS189413_19210 [Bacteroidia bacterium]
MQTQIREIIISKPSDEWETILEGLTYLFRQSMYEMLIKINPSEKADAVSVAFMFCNELMEELYVSKESEASE